MLPCPAGSASVDREPPSWTRFLPNRSMVFAARKLSQHKLLEAFPGKPSSWKAFPRKWNGDSHFVARALPPVFQLSRCIPNPITSVFPFLRPPGQFVAIILNLRAQASGANSLCTGAVYPPPESRYSRAFASGLSSPRNEGKYPMATRRKSSCGKPLLGMTRLGSDSQNCCAGN